MKGAIYYSSSLYVRCTLVNIRRIYYANWQILSILFHNVISSHIPQFGTRVGSMAHLTGCPVYCITCMFENLMAATSDVVSEATFWVIRHLFGFTAVFEIEGISRANAISDTDLRFYVSPRRQRVFKTLCRTYHFKIVSKHIYYIYIILHYIFSNLFERWLDIKNVHKGTILKNKTHDKE